MSTPSKEALEAANELFPDAICFYRFVAENAAEIIDRHFAPLRRRAKQAEARVKELESDLKTVAKAEFYLRHTNAELVGALRDARHLVAEWESADGEPATELLKRIDAALDRHAAGEPEAQK